MKRTAFRWMVHGLWLTVGLVYSAPVLAQPTSKPVHSKPTSWLHLNGQKVRVFWSDGDTFKVLEGSYKGSKARLSGFNTLESYGPVHRWGKWTAKGLQSIADQATFFVRKRTWTCTTKGSKDRYNRILAACPGLKKELIRNGLAHLFVWATPQSKRSKELNIVQKLQQVAQKQKKGMWAQGTPRWIVTSVHSYHEKKKTTYNRLISTQTGYSSKRLHAQTYSTCQWVCIRTSCLLYVPYTKRYGSQRATCLR